MFATPVPQVMGASRNFGGDLGVRCRSATSVRKVNHSTCSTSPSDQKRTKLVARQMMLMAQEINRRVDTLPRGATPTLRVSCGTCHRGVGRPGAVVHRAQCDRDDPGADSAVRAYKALRNRYYGGATYDFGESSRSIAAFRLARASKFDEAFALLRLNEELYPNSSGGAVFRGDILRDFFIERATNEDRAALNTSPVPALLSDHDVQHLHVLHALARPQRSARTLSSR